MSVNKTDIASLLDGEHKRLSELEPWYNANKNAVPPAVGYAVYRELQLVKADIRKHEMLQAKEM